MQSRVGMSRKLAVASWSLSCFSKEGGRPGPECCYLIYQDYIPPLPPSRGSTPPFSSSVPAAAAAWSLLLLLLLASHLRLALLVAAACCLRAWCCWLRFAAVAVWGCWLLLVLKKAYSIESRVVAFPLSREAMLISLYPEQACTGMYPPHNPQDYKSECAIRYPCRSKDDTYCTHERQNPVRCLNGLFASLMVVRVPCSSDREHARALRRSIRSLTHVRAQPLDVNRAHRCWLHR